MADWYRILNCSSCINQEDFPYCLELHRIKPSWRTEWKHICKNFKSKTNEENIDREDYKRRKTT